MKQFLLLFAVALSAFRAALRDKGYTLTGTLGGIADSTKIYMYYRLRCT